jgi:hypothetical protein
LAVRVREAAADAHLERAAVEDDPVGRVHAAWRVGGQDATVAARLRARAAHW